MGRKLVLGPKNVIEETGMDTTATGEKSYCEFLDLISYDLIWSSGNTPVATVTIQYSNDNESWITIDFGSTISISGASGSHRIDIKPNFKYVRPVVTFSSGDTDLTMQVKGTTKGA